MALVGKQSRIRVHLVISAPADTAETMAMDLLDSAVRLDSELGDKAIALSGWEVTRTVRGDRCIGKIKVTL